MRYLHSVEVALDLGYTTAGGLWADVDAEGGQCAEAEVDEAGPAEGLHETVYALITFKVVS